MPCAAVVIGTFGAGVFEKFAEAAILALAHRTIQAHRMAADVQHAAGFLDAEIGRPGRFFGRRLAAQFLQQRFETLRSRERTSIMWTGMRIVRAWSAMARVMAWRIHQVA